MRWCFQMARWATVAALLSSMCDKAHGALLDTRVRYQPVGEVWNAVYGDGSYSGGVDGDGKPHGLGVARTSSQEYFGGECIHGPPFSSRCALFGGHALRNRVHLSSLSSIGSLSPPWRARSSSSIISAEFEHGLRSGTGMLIDHTENATYGGEWSTNDRSGLGCWHVESTAEGSGGHCGMWSDSVPTGCGYRWNDDSDRERFSVAIVSCALQARVSVRDPSAGPQGKLDLFIGAFDVPFRPLRSGKAMNILLYLTRMPKSSATVQCLLRGASRKLHSIWQMMLA